MLQNQNHSMHASKDTEQQLTVLPCRNINMQIIHTGNEEAVTQIVSSCTITTNQHVLTLAAEATTLSHTSTKANNQNQQPTYCNNNDVQLQIKQTDSMKEVHDTANVLTSDKNEKWQNVRNQNINESCTRSNQDKLDDLNYSNGHADPVQCINCSITISPFPHSPSCIGAKTILPVARPPSRLPYKTPMSSKSATPLSLPPSLSSAATSLKSIGSVEHLRIITPPQPPPTPSSITTQNNEIKVSSTYTSMTSLLPKTNQEGIDKHFHVKDITNGGQVIQGKVCQTITSVQNSDEVATSNENLCTNNVNDNYSYNSIINIRANSSAQVPVQRKRLHECNTSNNDIQANANVMHSSTFHLSKATTTIVNNAFSPVCSPSSLMQQQQQQSQKLSFLASKHQKKLKNWSQLLLKAIMQHEGENYINNESVLELCTRIAHAIPGDAQAAKDTLLILLVHLRDPENGELRQRLITGKLPVEVLISMDEHDLVNPRRRRKLDEEFEERAKDRNLTQIKKAMQTTSRLFACPVCKERDCTWYQKQTRSADEPMTIFCTCNKCNSTWKRY